MNVFGKFEIRALYPHEVDRSMMMDLWKVAMSGFGKYVPFKEVENAVKKPDKLFVSYYNGDPAAFASYSTVNSDLAYLSAVVVHGGFKKRGLCRELTKKIIGELRGRLDYVSARTQNPVVYHVLSSFLKEIFPGEKPATGKVIELAKTIDSRVDGHLMVRGFYGRRLSSFEFSAEDERTNRIFGRLDLNRGDAYILVGLL